MTAWSEGTQQALVVKKSPGPCPAHITRWRAALRGPRAGHAPWQSLAAAATWSLRMPFLALILGCRPSSPGKSLKALSPESSVALGFGYQGAAFSCGSFGGTPGAISQGSDFQEVYRKIEASKRRPKVGALQISLVRHTSALRPAKSAMPGPFAPPPVLPGPRPWQPRRPRSPGVPWEASVERTCQDADADPASCESWVQGLLKAVGNLRHFATPYRRTPNQLSQLQCC